MGAGPPDLSIAAPHDPTRRRLMAAAATALAAPFLPSLTWAAAEPASPATPIAPTDLEPRVEALLDYLAVHFSPHLTAGSMRQDVGRDLTGLLRAAAAVRGVELANHEEPDFLFTAAGPS